MEVSMNIYKHELKVGFKPFIFWTIGLAFLLIAGMTKFLGFEEATGNGVTMVLEKIPKVILIVFGMGEVDILTPGGYYSVLGSYATICTIIYAINLGSNSVARESIDETYEFIFTKPCSRTYILLNKILAAFTYLFIFCILNLFFSYISFIIYDIDNTIVKEMILFAISNALVGILFFTVSIFLAAYARKIEQGISNSYKIFLITYIASVLYDLFNWSELTKYSFHFNILKQLIY
jgi:ABC-2 type transport system permease protein